MSKIFHAGAEVASAIEKPQGSAQQAAPEPSGTGTAPEAASPVPSAPPVLSALQQPVDVEAVLSDMAGKKGGGGNYKSSIVDLLKLLDLDSSLAARKTLADELNVHVGGDGTAEENIALHKAVMQKLEENGGKVPASLKG